MKRLQNYLRAKKRAYDAHQYDGDLGQLVPQPSHRLRKVVMGSLAAAAALLLTITWFKNQPAAKNENTKEGIVVTTPNGTSNESIVPDDVPLRSMDKRKLKIKPARFGLPSYSLVGKPPPTPAIRYVQHTMTIPAATSNRTWSKDKRRVFGLPDLSLTTTTIASLPKLSSHARRSLKQSSWQEKSRQSRRFEFKL